MTSLKVSQNETQHGQGGQHHLIRGESGALRLWHNEQPSDSGDKSPHSNDYETLGYVISGRMDLMVDGETISLAPGDSYRVPKGAQHSYRILETLSAIETTIPGAV
jgi:mannose-6-phosphate isomerase-like protein (cupin superfamily)